MTNFLPKDYKIPTTSNYMKFLEGDNTFRVMSSAIIGYEYFNTENKPVRSREPFDETPDIKKDGSVKHFWAFIVWNYEAKRIQILELTQKGIMGTMQEYVKNEKWGAPTEYDFIVNRKGSGLETEYKVTVNPQSDTPEEATATLEKMTINLEALYTGADPFKNTDDTIEYPDEEE